MKHYLDLEKAVGDVDLRPAVYIGDSMTEGMKRSINKYYAQRGVPVLVLDKRGSQSKGWHEVFNSKTGLSGWKKRAKSQYDAFMKKHPNAQFNIGSLGGNAWPTARKGNQALTDYSNKYTRFLFQKVKDTGGIVGGTTTSGARGSRFRSAHTGTDSHDDLKGLVNTKYSALAKEMGVPYYDARSAPGSESWRPPKGAVHPAWSAYKKMASARMKGQQRLSNQAYSAPMSTADARSSTAKIEAPTQSLASPKDLRPPAPAVASRPAPTKPAAPTRPTTSPQRPVTTLRSDLVTSKPKQEAARPMPVRKSLWIDEDTSKNTDLYKAKLELDRTKGKTLFGAPFKGRVTPKMWAALKRSEEDYRVSDPENYDKFATRWQDLNRHVQKFYKIRKDHGKRTAKQYWKNTAYSHIMPGGVGVGFAGKNTGHKTGNELDLAFGNSKTPGRAGGMKFPSGLLAALNRNNIYSASRDPGHRHHLYFKDPNVEGPKWKQKLRHRGKVRSQKQLYPRDTRGFEGMAAPTHVKGSNMPTTMDRPTPIPPRSRRIAQKYGVSGYESASERMSVPVRSSRDLPSPPVDAPMSTADGRTSTPKLEAPTPKRQTFARPVGVATRPSPVKKSLFQVTYFIED